MQHSLFCCACLPFCNALWPIVVMMLSINIFVQPISALATDLVSTPVSKQDNKEQPAQKSLEDLSPPWYDADQGDHRQILVQPQKIDTMEGRHSKNRREPFDWDKWWNGLFNSGNTSNNNTATSNNTANWGLSPETTFVLQMFVLFLLLALIAGVIFWTYRRQSSYLHRIRKRSKIDPSQKGRLEALGVEIDNPMTDLLQQAHFYQQQGDYQKAIIYFYSYQLTELDKAKFVYLEKGKTNRQYLREAVQNHWSMVPLLQLTIYAFEEVFFGKHKLSQAQFQTCWNELDNLKKLFHSNVPSNPLPPS
ncbi:MAG: hypothetical protein MPJ24_05810 [Pirellulaceae bacterium]|nr:hypothetical protein [Pirellulaceae bacterium]